MIIIPIVITVPDRSLMGTQRSRVRIMQCMVQRIWHLPLQIPATLHSVNIGMSLDDKKISGDCRGSADRLKASG